MTKIKVGEAARDLLVQIGRISGVFNDAGKSAGDHGKDCAEFCKWSYWRNRRNLRGVLWWRVLP